MIILKVKEGSLDKTLKIFKKRFDKQKTLKEIRSRQFFLKKSVKIRNQVRKAAYSNKYYSKEDI